MKVFKITITLFFLFVLKVESQESSVEVFPNRYRISWETVAMQTEEDLGFVGIGFDLFHLVNKSSTVYVGINSYSAMSGIRPGLITLGMSAGWCPQIFNNGFYLDMGAFVGGGGGGGADDGGGLILRPHLVLEKRFGNLGLRLGVSRIDFPSGSIEGNQVNVGVSYSGKNYFKVTQNEYGFIPTAELQTNKLRVAMVGTQYFNLKEGSVPGKPDVEEVGLVGVQIERNFSDYAYGILKLNGAYSGGTDGYMSIFLGAGGKLPVVRNRLNVEGRFLFGPTGGGGIESGGGATAQAEIGLSVLFGNGYDLKVMTGKTFAPWGPFSTNHLEVGIGKSFDRLFPTEVSNKTHEFNVDSNAYVVNHMAFSVYNRTYFPPSALDKSGVPYLSSFNLLGFEIQKFIGERFSINGGTVWAYQGNYGAYAEGLLGATYHQPIVDNWYLTAKGMFGAAGGGDLDLGGGLLFEYTVGIERVLNQKWNLFANFGKVQPLEGNFAPLSLDFGLKFHINQLIKKNN